MTTIDGQQELPPELQSRPRFTPNRLLWKVPGMHPGYDDEIPTDPGRFVVNDPERADVVSSIAADGLHYPVLDLDFDAELRPSETEGHYHLFINRGIAWEDYERLLEALRDCGLLQRGYVRASLQRGHTAVAIRPWKGNR